MYTLHVLETKKELNADNGEYYYDLNCQIFKDDVEVETRRLAFTADQILSEAGIQEELNKFLSTYVADLALAATNKDADEKEAKIQEALSGLTDVQVEAPEVIKGGENGEVIAPVETPIETPVEAPAETPAEDQVPAEDVTPMEETSGD